MVVESGGSRARRSGDGGGGGDGVCREEGTGGHRVNGSKEKSFLATTTGWMKLELLLLLYLVQGLPFGLQVKTLPILLRQEGISLSAISSLGMLSFPWLIKLAWAPLVDSYFWPSVGRRKSWILPCLLIIGAFSCTAMVWRSIEYLLLTIFVMNLAASIQDVATDGLAIDLLTDEESLAFGNAAQVVGFKAGMMLAGGLVPWMFAGDPWLGCFGTIAGTTFSIALVLFLYKEPPSSVPKSMATTAEDKAKTAPTAAARTAEGASTAERASTAEGLREQPAHVHDTEDILRQMRQVYVMVVRQFKRPMVRPLLLLLLTYKSGEVMADVMFKPFLLDEGIEADTVSLWTGVFGSVFSILGSLAGGFLSGRFSAASTLFVFGVLRMLAQFGRAIAASRGVSEEHPVPILALIGGEAITGGVVTTAVFTIMMAYSQPDVAGTTNTATFYTTLTTLELLGKSGSSMLSGVLAEYLGYQPFFFLTAVMSAVPLLFVRKLKLHND